MQCVRKIRVICQVLQPSSCADSLVLPRLFGKKTEAGNIFLSFEQSAHLLLERRKEAANIVLREILSHFRENFNWGCECV